MRPWYVIQDITYDPDTLHEYLEKTLSPIKPSLSLEDSSNESSETEQSRLVEIIEKNKNNPEFISWAYQNDLWLQIEEKNQRLSIQYELFLAYLSLLIEKKQRESIIVDYIIEMENIGEPLWLAKAKDLLEQEMGY